MAADKWSIGVDLGGTKIEAASVDQNGAIRDRIKKKTNVTGGVEAIQDQIEELAQKLINKASGPPVSLGIGVAGQIDKQTGAVSYAPNLKWHDVPLDADLEKRLGIPVSVLNDVRAATWGEWLHGAGKGCRDMICIFVGTGVGGSIVSEGHMVEGGSNSGGEVGHMTVMLDGPVCSCGNKGCLEALAGSWAIQRDAQQAIKEHSAIDTMMLALAGSLEDVKAKTVIEAYNKGDELAGKIIRRVTHALAGGLTGLTNVLNPQRIILGGGVVEHLPGIIPKIEKKVRKNALKAAVEPLKIVPTGLSDGSGMIGAAAYTSRMEQKNDI